MAHEEGGARATTWDATAQPPFPQVPGVEIDHRMVHARGLRFHVALAGPADAEPLVLLHGWPQHWYEWRKVLPELAQRRRCVLPDLRGLGWSDAPAQGYLKQDLADDVLAVLDTLCVDTTDLIAHDRGGSDPTSRRTASSATGDAWPDYD